MIPNLFGPAIEPSDGRIVEVGWAVTDAKASALWDGPAPFQRGLPRPASAKSVQLCPAAIDFDSRHFVVPCPFDLHLRFAKDDNGRPGVTLVDGARSTIRPKHLNQMVTIVNQTEWRRPDRPILQVRTPYLFLADEPVWLNQIAPYLDYADPPWPGLLIAGRFPVHLWPRELMWAFEWCDTSKDLMINRGQPWFYVRFDVHDPSRPVRVVEVEITPTIQAFLDSISGVTNYVNRTFSLFERAQKRRPAKLLVKRDA